MKIDPGHIPAALDAVHILLAIAIVFCLLLFILSTRRHRRIHRQREEDRRKTDTALQAGASALRKSNREDAGIESAPPAATAPAAAAPAAPAARATTVFMSPPEDAALQVLSLLQQNARLIDFFMQDIEGYTDADIGAATRVVHQGGRQTLEKYFAVSPIRTEDEGATLSLSPDYNPAEVHVAGGPSGSGPWQGTLIHRGWRVTRVHLPQLAEGHDARIVAPAEVEV